MEFWAALAGALIGGALVIASDVLRRRHEWDSELLNHLLDRAGDIAAAYVRIQGELTYGRRNGVMVDQVLRSAAIEQRHAAVTRFFMTPGSDVLRSEVTRLIRSWEPLVSAYSKPDPEWTEAANEARDSRRAFEGAVRERITSRNLAP